MVLYHNNFFYQTSILLKKSLRLTRNCRTWTKSYFQQVCHKNVAQNQKPLKKYCSVENYLHIYIVIINWWKGKPSKVHVLLKSWLQIVVLVVACKHFPGIFTSPRSGAVKRFVISQSSFESPKLNTSTTVLCECWMLSAPIIIRQIYRKLFFRNNERWAQHSTFTYYWF